MISKIWFHHCLRFSQYLAMIYQLHTLLILMLVGDVFGLVFSCYIWQTCIELVDLVIGNHSSWKLISLQQIHLFISSTIWTICRWARLSASHIAFECTYTAAIDYGIDYMFAEFSTVRQIHMSCMCTFIILISRHPL